MAGLSSPGLGSGLDINSLVSQLVAAEKAPAQAQITRAQTCTVTTISALGTAQGRARCIQCGADAAQDAGVVLRRARRPHRTPEIFTASATNARPPGSYDIQVESAGDGAPAHIRPVRERRGAGGRHRHAHHRRRHQDFPGRHRRAPTTRSRRSATRSTRPPATTTWCAPRSSTPPTARTWCCRPVATGAANAITVAQAGGDGGLASLVYNPTLTTNYARAARGADARGVHRRLRAAQRDQHHRRTPSKA